MMKISPRILQPAVAEITSGQMVSYRLSMPNPSNHLAEIELQLQEPNRDWIDLVMPVWTPGSYLIREFPRHVQELTALGDGRQLTVEKRSKNVWRLETKGRRFIEVRYKVYCNELTVRTSHLDDRHGFFSPPTLFFRVAHWPAARYELEIRPPEGWRVSTSLRPLGAGVYGASSFDDLMDAPLEIGGHEVIPFTVGGIPHELILYCEFGTDDQGRGLQAFARRLVVDLTPLVEESSKLFGGLPYGRYLFILHLVPGHRGGLEHRSSMVCGGDPRIFGSEAGYRKFLGLLSHEFFHVWNVKRIRPRAFRDCDYSREVYTGLLWLFEGFTTYYEHLQLVRAKLTTSRQFLEGLSREISVVMATPGRHLQSLERASRDAWIKQYRKDENTRNTAVSYYSKGCLVALHLDLLIRRDSCDRLSLDDVMREMWRRYQESGKGLGENEFETLVFQVTGRDYSDFFEQAIRGTADLEIEVPLAAVGVELRRGVWRRGQLAIDLSGLSSMGARVRAKGDFLEIVEVSPGGAAAEAGIDPGDLLVAVNDRKIDLRNFTENVAITPPGTRLKFHLFRRERLREFNLCLRVPLPTDCELLFRADRGSNQFRAFQEWLGRGHSTEIRDIAAGPVE